MHLSCDGFLTWWHKWAIELNYWDRRLGNRQNEFRVFYGLEHASPNLCVKYLAPVTHIGSSAGSGRAGACSVSVCTTIRVFVAIYSCTRCPRYGRTYGRATGGAVVSCWPDSPAVVDEFSVVDSSSMRVTGNFGTGSVMGSSRIMTSSVNSSTGGSSVIVSLSSANTSVADFFIPPRIT